jgi:serine/threonine-protein kinase
MIGRTIAHYRIIGKLGQGGMGEVYLSEDIKLGRRAALKFLSTQVVGAGDERERFLHEAQAAAALDAAHARGVALMAGDLRTLR